MSADRSLDQRFLLDENLSPRHAEWLRAVGKDAVSVVEVGLRGATDELVWEEAQRTAAVLVSLDSHFANLLRYPPGQSAGVIWLKLRPPTEASIRAAFERILGLLGGVQLTGCFLSWRKTQSEFADRSRGGKGAR